MSSEDVLSLFIDVASSIAATPEAREDSSSSVAATENHWLWFGTERDRVLAQYRVVPARWMLPSHEWRSLQPRPGHPPGLQSRRYDGDPGEFARLTIESQALSPAHVLDRTFFAWSGPPVCRADGVVVAGNQRAIMILRAVYGDREGRRARYEQYAQELEQRRSLWAIPSDPFPETPVLVRVIVDDRYADLDAATPAFARLNRLSDRAASKAYDPVSAGSALADDLEQSPEVLEALLSRARDRHLGSFLAAANGHDILAQLTRANAISVSEHGGLIDPRTNHLTPQACKRIADAVELIALGRRRDLAERAPKLLERLRASYVRLVLSARHPRGAFARSAIIEALDLLVCTSTRGLSGDAIVQRCEAEFGRRPTDAGRAFASFLVRAQATDLAWVLSDWLAPTHGAREIFDTFPDVDDTSDLNGEWQALLRSTPTGTSTDAEEAFERARQIIAAAAADPTDRTTRDAVDDLKRGILPDVEWAELKSVLRGWWRGVDQPATRGRGRPEVPARAVITLLVFLEAHGRRDSCYLHWGEFGRAFGAGSWTMASRRMAKLPGNPERANQLAALDAAVDRAAKAYARRAFKEPNSRMS